MRQGTRPPTDLRWLAVLALLGVLAAACGGDGAANAVPEASFDGFDAPVYWLGDGLDGSGQFPPLELASVDGNALVYAGTDDELDWGLVTVRVFAPSAWTQEEQGQDNPCVEDEELSLDDRDVTIRKEFQVTDFLPAQHCPFPDTFSAVVHFDDAVVEVEAPDLETVERTARSPYNTEDGVELLARGLRPRAE